jgi:hypothetical protein
MQRRNAAQDARAKQGRDGGIQSPDPPPSLGPSQLRTPPQEGQPGGDIPWDRIIDMINFNLSRPNAPDLSRFKSVLYACKAKGLAVPSGV